MKKFRKKLDLDVFKKTFRDSKIFMTQKQILVYFRNFRCGNPVKSTFGNVDQKYN